MGQFVCCRNSNNFQTKNQFLCQLNRYIQHSKSDIFSDTKKNNCHEQKIEENYYMYRSQCFKENLNPEKDSYKLLFYDISQNNILFIKKKFEIVKSLEGLSELNLNHALYLCGNSKLQDNEGSFLFEINPINPKTKILVNSRYGHYYPSLISLQNKYIFCIGGKNQIHCEYYNIEQNYWESIPNLPEERYMCTLSLDSNNNIYLFGGINSKKSNKENKLYIENNYILRFKLNIGNIGIYINLEKILIKKDNEKKLLKRISAGSLIFDEQKDNIYILGGEDEQRHYLDDIIKFNINSYDIIKTKHYLHFPTIFFNQYSQKNENNTYMHSFIDKFNNVIKIDEHDFIEWSYEKIDI